MFKGLNEHTLMGHQSSVNHAIFDQQGTKIISCDSQGFARIWDLRTLSNFANFDRNNSAKIVYLHKESKNKLSSNFGATHMTIDLNGEFVVIGCKNGKIYCVEILGDEVGQLLLLFIYYEKYY